MSVASRRWRWALYAGATVVLGAAAALLLPGWLDGPVLDSTGTQVIAPAPTLRAAPTAAAGATAAAAAGGGGGGHHHAASAAAQIPKEALITTGLRVALYDGTYVVGQDLAPGNYESTGARAADQTCHWARLRSTVPGAADAVIAQGDPSGLSTVVVRSTDQAFLTQGCALWRKR